MSASSLVPLYWACDTANSEFEGFDNLEDAIACCNIWIKDYRDACDPEWPYGVAEITITYGVYNPNEDEDQSEQLPEVARATECDIQYFETEEEAEAAGCQYMCDYRMEVRS